MSAITVPQSQSPSHLESQHLNDTVILTHERLDTQSAQNAVGASHAGAISVFVGTTRDHFDGKKVLSLQYEAYDEMAIKQMEQLCDRSRLKWPDLIKICIMHRLGTVPVGEASVVIAVSSAHRRESIG